MYGLKRDSPAKSTNYNVVDGQVIIPSSAIERKGIQPVVFAKVNGGKRADVKVGQTFFTGRINTHMPERLCRLVLDFDGDNTYPVASKIMKGAANSASVKSKYVFTKPGTYFAVLRVTSQREGDKNATFAKIYNLDRVRIVVN